MADPGLISDWLVAGNSAPQTWVLSVGYANL
jgi:hypothetical protein